MVDPDRRQARAQPRLRFRRPPGPATAPPLMLLQAHLAEVSSKINWFKMKLLTKTVDEVKEAPPSPRPLVEPPSGTSLPCAHGTSGGAKLLLER